MWDPIIHLGKHTTKNWNTILAYYNAAEKEPKPSISYNWHCIYIKWVTTKECASDTLKNRFKAWKEELKWLLRLIKPAYFMPIHGEYRMLKNHADLATECDIPKEKTFVCENGDVELLDHH